MEVAIVQDIHIYNISTLFTSVVKHVQCAHNVTYVTNVTNVTYVTNVTNMNCLRRKSVSMSNLLLELSVVMLREQW